ncbi:MAG: OmpA family protein [Spirochaetia bacterium]|jgi:outer membrane protein OmpA-like peptidoglycan-associated protein
MRNKLLFWLPVFVLAAASALSADVFRFSYTKGEEYRIVSTVHESVAVNGAFSHDADILNKIAVTVTDTKGDAGYHDVTFQTSERTYGSTNTYAWSEDYHSLFWRDGRGTYIIDPSYFMPVVRNVPLFPEGDVPLKGTWVAQGNEAHDFRLNFGIAEPFQFPITADYTYLANETRDGIDCAVIAINYEIFHKVTPPRGAGMYPTRVAGYSHQKYWWDRAGGRPIFYEEEFDFVFSFTSGDEVEYTGDADGRLIEAERLDRARVTGEIQQQIDTQHIPDVTVRPTDQGVTITLENVNFPPNSDTLLPAEQDKLRRLAEVLKKYPDRDIAIAGFTARAPGYTEQDYQKLSEQRARAAADFLLSIGARQAEQVTARGMGANSPLGDNATEEGRRMNRRVEITILEN